MYGFRDLAYTIDKMDEVGIERATINVDDGIEAAKQALAKHPDRFFPSLEVNPLNGMDEVRKLRRMVEEYGVKAATASPAFTRPQVPIDDKMFYPIYAACVDLDIPICVTTGVPGPRLPMSPQKVERIDEVCRSLSVSSPRSLRLSFHHPGHALVPACTLPCFPAGALGGAARGRGRA